MMLLGDKSRFAIQFELDPDPGGAWLFGRVCYWICGQSVGDYPLGTSLRDVLFRWERIACDAGLRTNEGLMQLDTGTLVDTLYDGLIGQSATESSIGRRAIEEQWARHDINPSVDVFFDWDVYLVEGEGLARCVWRHVPTGSCHECQLNCGEFDTVLREAVGALVQHYDTLSSTEHPE